MIRNFGFGKATNYVDEIIIILVKKQPSDSDFENFFKDILKLRTNLFIPITLGGGIRNYEISERFFNMSALGSLTLNEEQIKTIIFQICLMLNFFQNELAFNQSIKSFYLVFSSSACN